MNSEELDAMFRRYREMPNDIVVSELRKEIDGFLSDAQAIKEVILHPERYADGQQIKEDYLWNIGLFYERSVLNKGFDVADKIFDFVYSIRKEADTVFMQPLYLKHIKYIDRVDGRNEKIFRLLEVIELNYERSLNKIKEILSAYEGKRNERLLKTNKDTASFMTSFADIKKGINERGQFYSLELLDSIVDKEKYGTAAAQIFEREYINTIKRYSLSALDRFLNKKQKKEYYKFLETTGDLRKILKHIMDAKLPYEIGIYPILRSAKDDVLYSIIKSKDIDPKFRLYALKSLSKLGQTEADIMFNKDNDDFVTKTMFTMVSAAQLDKEVFETAAARFKKAEDSYEIKDLFTKEELKEMAEIADRIISDKKFISDKNPYSSSIAEEVLMTALIVKAAYYADEKDKFDIIAALRELPFVVSFSSNNSYKSVELTSGEGARAILLQDAGLELTFRVMSKYIEAIEYSISQATKTASGAYRIIDALKNDEVIRDGKRL